MGELLHALKHLQDVHSKIIHIRQGEDRRLRQVHSAQRQIKRINDNIAEIDIERRSLQSIVDDLEHNVNRREEAVKHHREALLTARTNRDYAQILTTINTEKADTAKLEKEALEKMAELEAIQERIDALVTERKTHEEKLAKYEKDLEAYRESVADKRAKLDKEHKEAGATVAPSAVATFTRVADKHEGEALAEIVRINPKRSDYACGGCHMTVTLDTVNAVKSRDEIQLCSVCGRILYLDA